MKAGFYLRTAWGNVKKNYRFFIPRILAGAGLLAVFYILLTLSMDERLSQVKGGSYIPVMMVFCSIIMAILSVIILLYANGFLMKQRKREFGLYNILGLEKRHVGRILFFESALCFVFAAAIGLLTGFLFYKLCTLLICRLLQSKVVDGFLYINARSVLPTVLFFLLLDIVIYFINRIQIARMKPVELLASAHTGEQEPKVSWLILSLGTVSLAAGYAIALAVKDPVNALGLFFVAVVLVIIGTYCLFSAGSIFILKCLKKNGSYYYQKKHMPAVSGLLYRMKHNAVGMASITILSCGILVMLSTTLCLYTGIKKTLSDLYPYDLYVSFYYYGDEDYIAHPLDPEKYGDILDPVFEEHDLAVADTQVQNIVRAVCPFKDGRILGAGEETARSDGSFIFSAMTQAEYRSHYGTDLGLGAGEIAVFTPSIKEKKLPETVSFGDRTFTIVRRVEEFPAGGVWLAAYPVFGLILPDGASFEEFSRIYGSSGLGTNRLAVRFADRAAAEADMTLNEDLSEALVTYIENSGLTISGYGYSFDTVWDGEEELFGESGTLLFIGIILGTVFLFATALIIYYKQISEGYEDQARFRIMEKIGLSSDEVKKTISQQLLLVFFLPLLASTVHIIVAFPILSKMLHLLLLSDTKVFIFYALAVYIVFVLVYYLIYRQTAKSYYKIVRWE